MDLTGVPTKMLSINSTVKIAFRNPATFFGVHVSSTPLVLFYYDLKIASGNVSILFFLIKEKKKKTILPSFLLLHFKCNMKNLATDTKTFHS